MKSLLKIVLGIVILSLPWIGYAAQPPVERRSNLQLDLSPSVRAALVLSQIKYEPAPEPETKPTPKSEVKPVPKPVAKPVAKPAPKATCPCGCGCTDCDCTTGGGCSDPNCACGMKTTKKGMTLGTALDNSAAYNKPLLIWVKEVCPPCEAEMSDFIHVHVEQYQGAQDLIDFPAVIVGKPDGQGGVTRVGTFRGIPTKEQVINLLYPPRIMYYAPPPMMNFGGACVGGG